MHDANSTPGHDRTANMIRRGRQVLANGDFDGLGRRPLVDECGDTFPFFATQADGYTIRDLNGHEYIDWVNRWGPMILGYRHPEVEQAIRDQFAAGPIMSMMHPVQIEVAEALCEMIPSAEMVAFGKNGSDACCAAVRLARAVTGREMILQHGFHGFHDWCMVQTSGAHGIPRDLQKFVASFPYNKIEALEKLFEEHQGRVAAVIMEPVNMWMPHDGYLARVLELVHAHGALLIFDEMVTSFRLANGGAQELFGVTPDLTCLGKAMGNGMPLSAIVGKREYMQHLSTCGFGMCYQLETLSLAAARKVLEIMNREPVVEHLAHVGERLRRGVDELAKRIGINARLVGPPSRLTFVFRDHDGLSKQYVRTLFQQECMRRGVLINGSVIPSYAHDDDAIAKSLAAFATALESVERTVANRKTCLTKVDGSPRAPGLAKRLQSATGFFDAFEFDSQALHLRGWLFLLDGPADKVEFVSHSGAVVVGRPEFRADLEQPFGEIRDVGQSGFTATLAAQDFSEGKDFQLTLMAYRGGEVVFRCLVDVTPNSARPSPYPLHDGVLSIK